MGHIFISYSHKDKDYVEKLEKKLIDEGFEVWIDHRIDYGTQWPKEIQRALDACDVFIIVVSENAYESEWVQAEVARAKRKKKPFYPLLLQGDAWLTIESTQYADVKDGSLPVKKFYDKLKSEITEKTTAQKAYSLLRSSMNSWVEFDVLPSLEILFVLWRDLAHNFLSEAEQAFLYCSYYLQSTITEEWIEDNEFFSFDGYLDKFVQRKNSSFPILQTFTLNQHYGWGMSSITSQDGIIISSKISVSIEKKTELPAVYFLVTANQTECLEVLLFKKEKRVEVFIAHTRTNAKEIMDTFFSKIEKINEKSS